MYIYSDNKYFKISRKESICSTPRVTNSSTGGETDRQTEVQSKQQISFRATCWALQQVLVQRKSSWFTEWEHFVTF